MLKLLLKLRCYLAQAVRFIDVVKYPSYTQGTEMDFVSMKGQHYGGSCKTSCVSVNLDYHSDLLKL